MTGPSPPRSPVAAVDKDCGEQSRSEEKKEQKALPDGDSGLGQGDESYSELVVPEDS